MKKIFLTLFLCLTMISSVFAQSKNDRYLIPQRAVVLHGDPAKADSTVIGVFYSRENLDFSDPDAPRFLLLDREGRVAFGIGGQLYAVASYDIRGAVDGPDFATYDIPVPSNPAQRERFGADLRCSALTARLVGRSDRFGIYQVYFQAKFSGDDGKYGFSLKQAYVTVGHLTAGLTNSTFIDGGVQAPTIDPQGDCGQVSGKNIIFRYTTPVFHNFKAAASVEVPKASYTLGAKTEKIAQRVPDIPVYIQYGASSGNHIRLAAIFRDLSYRDLVSEKNMLQPGWGLKLSGITNIGMFSPFGHFSYGKGISSYVNDLSGNGFDLVPDSESGRLKAVPSMTWTVGSYFNFSKKLFSTASFSRSQIFDCASMGADTYRYGMYLALNTFYNVDDNFRLGAEWLHGWRNNYNGETGTANRVELLLQYSF